MNWYKILKLAQNFTNPPRGVEYTDFGHNWHDETEGTPPNKDAAADTVWIFNNNRFNAVTAQEWFDGGNWGIDFVHDDVFGQSGYSDIYGRYEARRNVLTIQGAEDGMPSILSRILDRRWPGAKIMSF